MRNNRIGLHAIDVQIDIFERNLYIYPDMLLYGAIKKSYNGWWWMILKKIIPIPSIHIYIYTHTRTFITHSKVHEFEA